MGKHHVIYIPGLGDHDPRLRNAQLLFLNKWQKAGATVHYQAIGWADGEGFVPKLNKVIELVDKLTLSGRRVSVIGVSAGASAALNVYMERRDKIRGVVYVCGKLTGTLNIDPKYYRNNPAFKESLYNAQANIRKLNRTDKTKMLSLYPIYDQVVAVADMKIPGVRTKMLPTILHSPSIFLAITLFRRTIIKEVGTTIDL
jgi:pimeloyl-ACP methyl ester carboxylesterase